MSMLTALSHKLSTAKNTLQKEGVVSVICLGLSRIFPAPNPILFWDRFVMIDGPVTTLKPVARADEPEYDIHEATWEDVCELSFLKYPDQEYKEVVQLERYAAGHKCIIVRVGAKIVGYTWLMFADSYAVNGLKAVPRGKYAWMCDFYIIPECRNSGLFMAMNIFKNQLIAKYGYDGCCGSVKFTNVRSKRTHARVNMNAYETVYFISFLGLRIHFRHGPGYFKPQMQWSLQLESL